MPDEPSKHITEALGGRALLPLTDEERVEYERVRLLIRAVMSCYDALIGGEADGARRDRLEGRRAAYAEVFRRRVGLSAEERAEILRTYPVLLDRLRVDLGE
jgi:hypothetical protein